MRSVECAPYARTFSHHRTPGCLLITLLTAIPLPVQAAVVMLKNGDRITGLIVKVGKQRIEIDQPFSDIIKITWEDVPRFP